MMFRRSAKDRPCCAPGERNLDADATLLRRRGICREGRVISVARQMISNKLFRQVRHIPSNEVMQKTSSFATPVLYSVHIS
jgi:hypothetical protein